ncbi:hypothetical protein ACVWY5_005577 [Bradyrhizobium sp. USDA 3256]
MAAGHCSSDASRETWLARRRWQGRGGGIAETAVSL